MYNIIIYVCILNVFSNLYLYNWIGWVHSLLTNFNNNYILLIMFFMLIKDFKFNKINLFLILLVCLFKYNFISVELIALHNNLFIYHPLLLYSSIIIIIFNKFKKIKNKNILLNISWLSFILGGYWASQEFNWGGWWNWDSLEMGVLFVLLCTTLLYHIKLSFLNTYLYAQCILYIAIYWIFNKFGITISIHSFIKNTSILKYTINISLILFLKKVSFFLLYTCIILIQLKFNFLSIFCFKLTLLYLLIFSKKLIFKKLIIQIFHNFFVYIGVFFSFVNLYNLTYYKKNNLSNYHFTLQFHTYYTKIITTVSMNFISNLKKDFFFFKFFNMCNITNGWFLQLNNFFSTNSWLLIIKMLKKYTKSFTKLHKKRIFNKSILTFNYINNINFLKKKKNIYIYFYKTFFVKFKFFRKLRKLLKKKLKKKYIQVYFFCKPNFLIHEKFKNARMGKGKGSPTIWVFQPNITHPTFIFKNCNVRRAFLIKYFLQTYFNPYLVIKLI